MPRSGTPEFMQSEQLKGRSTPETSSLVQELEGKYSNQPVYLKMK